MIRTVTRWNPVLLMRDALGRFMALGVPKITRRTRSPRMTTRIPAIQLALF